VTDEEEAMKSFPKARKAVLFQRAIVNARRREQTAAPATPRTGTSQGISQGISMGANAVKAQQDRLRDAFPGKDAA